MKTWLNVPYAVRRLFQFLGVYLALFLTCQVSLASGKVALVVGNASYTNLPVLKTPHSDGQKIALKLRNLGYETTLLLDVSRQEFLIALAQLRVRSAHAEKVVIYFAGHGTQYHGQNVLFPITASEGQPFERALTVQTLIRAVSDKARQKFIFIDACRDPSEYGDLDATQIPAMTPHYPAGLFVSYSAQPGAEAYDGNGVNSPFAMAFLKYAGQAAEIEEVARSIRIDVIRKTQGRQIPWTQSSLLRQAYLHQ